MQTSARVAVNAVSSWALTLLNGAIGLVLVPFLLAQLGREGYGLVGLMGVVVSLMMIADLGIRGALGRHLAEQVARKDDRRFNELVSSAMVFYGCVGLLVAGVLVVLAPLAAEAFNVSETMMPQAVFLIRYYASVAGVLTLITSVFNATLTSNNRFTTLNMINSCTALVKGLLLLAVLGLTETGLYGWATVMLVSKGLDILLVRRAAYRMRPSLDLRLSGFRKRSMVKLFALGGYLFVGQLTGLISIKSDPIVLTTFLGPMAVALYTPAVAMAATFHPLVGAMVGQLHPLATDLHVTGRREELQQVLLRGTRYTFLMGVGVCVVLGVFAEPICRLWLSDRLGTDYRITAWLLTGWALADLSLYAAGTQWPVLLGMNRLKFLVWMQLPLAVVNIVASIILVGYTSLGILGVIVPTVIINAIRRPVIIVYTARQVGLSSGRYFREAYARPLMVLGLLVLLAAVLRWLVAPAGWLSLAACASATGVGWLILTWLIGFGADDRSSVRSLTRWGWRRARGHVPKPESVSAAPSPTLPSDVAAGALGQADDKEAGDMEVP